MTGDRFSDDSRTITTQALQHALRLGHMYIQPEHILLALASTDNPVITAVWGELDVDAERIRKAVITVLIRAGTSHQDKLVT